jgi:hypothetical protein
VDYGNTFAHIVYTNARWTTSSRFADRTAKFSGCPKSQ